MAIGQVYAGAYTATLGGQSTGAFNDEQGFELEQQTHGENIDRTDVFGDSLLDWIHRGGSVFMTFNSMIYGAGSKTPFYPWGSFGVMATAAAPIGRRASDVASALVMTVVANTPAAVSGPSTLTASKAILPPGANLKLLYSTKVRKVPIKLALLPSESAGTVTWWTET